MPRKAKNIKKQTNPEETKHETNDQPANDLPQQEVAKEDVTKPKKQINKLYCPDDKDLDVEEEKQGGTQSTRVDEGDKPSEVSQQLRKLNDGSAIAPQRRTRTTRNSKHSFEDSIDDMIDDLDIDEQSQPKLIEEFKIEEEVLVKGKKRDKVGQKVSNKPPQKDQK